MAEDKDVYSGTAWTDPKAWDALVELARAIVAIADKDAGEGCDFANTHVSHWKEIDHPTRPGEKMEMRYVVLTFTLPAAKADVALHRAGVLKHDDQLAKDQEIRASLIEME